MLFDFDQSEIRPDAEPVLQRLAELIIDRKPTSVEITGHTDSRGAAEYNQALSERRAEAARDFLVASFGLEADVMKTEGRGEREPVANNQTAGGGDDPEGRQRNRRVEVLLRE